MENEIRFYSLQEVSDLLGVNLVSIQRWVESGKLESAISEDGNRKFNVNQLSEFTKTYNISMKFLDK